MHAISKVFEFPPNESESKRVNLEFLYEKSSGINKNKTYKQFSCLDN